MWQKARQISKTNVNVPEDGIVGLILWVEDKPYLEAPDLLVYYTNIYEGEFGIAVQASNIELLPEFAESVEKISWEEFIKCPA